jgi:hypothetical protein
MQVDWLGAHALRQLEKKHNKNTLENVATWIGKKNKTFGEKILSGILFVVLTIPIDPLIVAIHYRKKHFKGLLWRDWGILIVAVFFANLWWLIQIGVVFEAIGFVLAYF